MGTPWGWPTTGATPSERNQSQQPGREAAELAGRWWLDGAGWGLAPAGKGDTTWGGGTSHPPPVQPLGHKKPRFTPSSEQSLALSRECRLLLLLPLGPPLPPHRAMRQQMEPSTAPPTPASCTQYLPQGVGHASLLSAGPRGHPGRVAAGRWTWLGAALRGQKALEGTRACGRARQCGAWGRRWPVTEGSGAGMGGNKATAPELDRFWRRQRTRRVTSHCQLPRNADARPACRGSTGLEAALPSASAAALRA